MTFLGGGVERTERFRQFYFYVLKTRQLPQLAFTLPNIIVPRVQREEDQVRLVAPTQMALCLRPCLLPTLKGES